MQALTNCLARFDSPGNFLAPTDFFKLPSKQRDADANIALHLILSVSQYALCIIANIHNKAMAATEIPNWAKVIIVLALDLAACGVFLFAKLEAIARLTVGVALLPIGILVACLCDNGILLIPLMTGIITAAQIPNAVWTIYNLSTSSSNVFPETTSSQITTTITCGLID